MSISLSPGALWAPCLSQHRCHLPRKDCSEVPTQLPTSRPSTQQHVILFNFPHYLESSYLWCFICLPLPVLKKILPLSRMCHVYGCVPLLSSRNYHIIVNSGGGSVAQSCLTLCDPMDCSPPGSSVHGILQARILEGVAISFSREPS